MTEWAMLHPWMTFFLGIAALECVCVFFKALGGGYWNGGARPKCDPQ